MSYLKVSSKSSFRYWVSWLFSYNFRFEVKISDSSSKFIARFFRTKFPVVEALISKYSLSFSIESISRVLKSSSPFALTNDSNKNWVLRLLNYIEAIYQRWFFFSYPLALRK